MSPVNVLTNHKNLEYFTMTKLLTWWQTRWSEYLCQFNMVICFWPRKLGTKLDALIRQWDIYIKEGGSDYGPQNLRPIFTTHQLSEFMRVTSLCIPALHASVLMDSEMLHHADILAHLSSDPVAQKHIGITSNLRWMQSDNGFSWHDNQIYVPKAGNLQLWVLQYKHDHVLSGHFSQNSTLSIIHHKNMLPGLRTFINDFFKSCTTCMHSKSQHHEPYGFLSSFQYPSNPGILSLWISLRSCPGLPDTLLFSW